MSHGKFTARLQHFFDDVLRAHRSFAEILNATADSCGDYMVIDASSIGVVLDALNVLAGNRLKAFSVQADANIGHITVEQPLPDVLIPSVVSKVFLNSPGKRFSEKACTGDTSPNFHPDASSEHLSAGDSSVQSA